MVQKTETKTETPIEVMKAFYDAFSDDEARKEALHEARGEIAAEVIIPLYGIVAEALKEAGLPVSDVLIFSKDGILHDPNTYNLDLKDLGDEDDEDEDDDDDDDDDEDDYDGKECLKLLKAHMKAEHISVAEASDELDVPKTTIKMWIKQDLRKSKIRAPEQENCAMILDYLGMEY